MRGLRLWHRVQWSEVTLAAISTSIPAYATPFSATFAIAISTVSIPAYDTPFSATSAIATSTVSIPPYDSPFSATSAITASAVSIATDTVTLTLTAAPLRPASPAHGVATAAADAAPIQVHAECARPAHSRAR